MVPVKFSAELKYDPFTVLYSRGHGYYAAMRQLEHQLKQIPNVTIDAGVTCFEGCAGEPMAKYDYFRLRNAAGREAELESPIEWVSHERARFWRDSVLREWLTGRRKKLFGQVLTTARQLSESNTRDLTSPPVVVPPDYGTPEEEPVMS